MTKLALRQRTELSGVGCLGGGGILHHCNQALIISASPQVVFLDGKTRYCPVCAVQQVTRNMKMRVYGPACSSLGCW